MNIKSNKLIGSVALAVATFSIAAPAKASDSQKNNNQTQQSSNQSSSQGVTALQNYNRGQRCSDIIGKQVTDSSGKDVGKIKDFVIDRGSGEIRYVLVSSGGLFGIDDQVRAVPPAAINPSNSNDGYTVNLDNQKWKDAPTAADNQLSALQQNQRGNEIYKYYGKSWKNANSDQNQGLTYATELKGRHIHSNGKDVGTIDDLMVNLDRGRASVVLDTDSNFTGSDSKYVVSFDKITAPDGSNNKLNTSLTKSDFQNANAFSEDTWLIPSFVEIYTWTVPMADNGNSSAQASNNHAKNSNSSNDNMAKSSTNNSSANSHASTNAAAPVDAVRSAIRGDSELGQSAQNIKVAKHDGKVVLRGTVSTEALKDKIENKAESAANGCPIDNQIKVASSD